MTSLPSSPFPISIRGTGLSLLGVLSDERSDGQRFVYAREFSADVFLHCYRVAHQEIFGLLNFVGLRRCVVAGKVAFSELREVVPGQVSIWETIREYVRYIKCESDKVGIDFLFFLFFCFSMVL